MTVFDQATEALCAFLPTLFKLQAVVLPSTDEVYWRSRWHEWVNPHSGDSKEEYEQKRILQLRWNEVWYYYQYLFTQSYKNPDRAKLKTHLMTCQQTAEWFLEYIQQQNQVIQEPQNEKLWYVRYSMWNETVQYGGLATLSPWPASWPLIQEGLQQRFAAPLPPVTPVDRYVDTRQMSLFDEQTHRNLRGLNKA
ncbi:hypothetical protein [Spirosoma luteum]|uniref:hypothetical protein n=1 Tax=Spirosoma luteum TaxID=431553 RepID=UPI000374A9D8|nr:hypothetical protein [Spirosoma luteum]